MELAQEEIVVEVAEHPHLLSHRWLGVAGKPERERKRERRASGRLGRREHVRSYSREKASAMPFFS